MNALETTEERDSLLPGARPWVGGGASLLPLSPGNFGLFMWSSFAFWLDRVILLVEMDFDPVL